MALNKCLSRCSRWRQSLIDHRLIEPLGRPSQPLRTPLQLRPILICKPKAVYSVGFASPGVGAGAAADDGADRVGRVLVTGFLSAAAALEVPVDFVAALLVAVVVDRGVAVRAVVERGVVERGVAALAGTVRGLVDDAADGVVGSASDTSG